MRDVDRGFERLKKRLEKIQRNPNFVKVGLLGDGKKNKRRGEGELTNLEIGIIHEFGAPPHIPERSFIRSTFEAQHPEFVRMIRMLVGQMVANPKGGMTARRALGLVGAKVAAEIKKRVTAGEPVPPPNTPEVFMRKLLGSRYAKRQFNKTGAPPRPLVDTGQMIGAVTWAVTAEGSSDKEP